MNEHDASFERLRRANPAPTRPVEDKPSAHEMLAVIRQQPAWQPPSDPERPRRWKPRLVLAAAAFVAVLLAALPLLLFGDQTDGDAPVATNPTVATTVTPTTDLSSTVTSTTSDAAPVPATTLPASDLPAAIDTQTQRLVDTFVTTYNSGDVEAFMALLHPDFKRDITGERALEPQPLDTVRTLYEVDAALNMEIALDCEQGTAALVCELRRFDDLHRVLGIGPTEDRRWFLAFEGGRLLNWGETRQNLAVEYEAEAMSPFLAWLRESRPEVVSPFPFTDGDWVPRDGIAVEIASLVREWADSLGVTLQD